MRQLTTIPSESTCKDLNRNLSRGTFDLPLSRVGGAIIALFHGREVGQRCDVQVPLQTGFSNRFVQGIDEFHLGRFLVCRINVFWLGCDVMDLALRGVVHFARGLDRVRSTTGKPGFPYDHAPLSNCPGLIGANVYQKPNGQ